MKTKALVIALTAIILTSTYSCKKANAPDHWQAQIELVAPGSATEIFKGLDAAKLKALTSSGNQLETQIMMTSVANKVATYFYTHFKRDVRKDFIDDPNRLVILGLFYAAKESRDLAMQRAGGGLKLPNDSAFDCFLTAVGTVIGIFDVKNIWNSIVAGATEDTVIAALKLIGGRVASIITLGIMVYEVGNCLNWW